MSDAGSCDVALQLLKLSQYYYVGIDSKLDHIVDPVYPLHNICEKHSNDLADSMCQQRYHHGLGLMTVVFSAEPNREASSVSSSFHEMEGGEVLKSGFVFILLDDCRRLNAMHKLQEEGGHS